MSVLPDHWVNKPRNTVMNTRRRIPAVLNRSIHDCLDASSSILIVVEICVISALTNSESRSPSAWYLVSISWASSALSLLMSHRGLSGTKKTKEIWIREGQICSREGIRHAQSLGRLLVP